MRVIRDLNPLAPTDCSCRTINARVAIRLSSVAHWKYNVGMMMRRTIVLCLGILAAAIGAAGAQGFPAKPIRVIVAYPPGGSTDIIARILGQKLTDRFGQTMLVDNRAGAAGVLPLQFSAGQTRHTLRLDGRKPRIYAMWAYSIACCAKNAGAGGRA